MGYREVEKYIASMFAVVALACCPLFSDDCCVEEEGQDEQEAPKLEYHLHFSSHDIDIYDQTPDTVYQDADWPSRIEEYSDYLSR